METDEPVLKGFLILRPSGKILKKASQKFCVLYKRSSSGVARIEIYENEAMTGQVKIITLEDVIKITPKSLNVINIFTKNSDMEFGTMSEENMNQWFEALKSVVFPSENTLTNDIEQDNDLYSSTDQGVFLVKLHPSDASQRCNLIATNYILVVTPSALQLRNEMGNKLLFTWPFNFIRKYGYKSGKFTFEAGRKCASGEGVFYLEHHNHNEIYRCLSTKMKNMKKILNGESTSPLIDSTDMQLHVALNMEPGSRNPLPPSVSAQSSFQESSQASLGLHFSSSMSSVENLSIVKAVPIKPPRKTIPPKNVIRALTPVVTVDKSYEHTDISDPEFNYDKYDTVESRIDAWKTMGVQEPAHSELIKSIGAIKLNEKVFAPPVITECTTSSGSEKYDCLQHFGSSGTLNVSSSFKNIENTSYPKETIPNYDVDYLTWGTSQVHQNKSEIKQTEKTHAPTVISEPNQSTDIQGYDHLNFFGPSSRLATSSDYKQVTSSAPIPMVNEPYNLYEEVGLIESARSADDSSLGYALIKKDRATCVLREIEDPRTTSLEGLQVEPQKITHHFKNSQAYAQLMPKRA